MGEIQQPTKACHTAAVALGWASLTGFVLCVAKYPLRKLGLHKANAFLMKLHELASFTVFAAGIAQMVIGIRHFRKTRPLAVWSGVTAWLIDFVIIGACHMTKNPVKKLRDHRVLSLASAIAAGIHLIACGCRK